MTDLTAKSLKAFEAALLSVMTATAKEHGVTLRFAGGNFSSEKATLKLEVLRGATKGELEATRKEQFMRYANMKYSDVKPEWFGALVDFGKTTFRVIGYLNSRSTKCIELEATLTGKRARCSPDAIEARFVPVVKTAKPKAAKAVKKVVAAKQPVVKAAVAKPAAKKPRAKSKFDDVFTV